MKNDVDVNFFVRFDTLRLCVLFPYSAQIPPRAWMQATRAVFCDPARVAPAAGSGSASMPVVLEAGSGSAILRSSSWKRAVICVLHAAVEQS